ncbi:SLOG family protein [Streptomyces flavidovirens]
MSDLTPYRVLVTGSRDWADEQPLTGQLTALLAASTFLGQTLTVVHGACPTGADHQADEWARWHQQRGSRIEIERHPAHDHGPWPACGPIRNAHMVRLGADACIAFIGPCTKATCKRPQPHGSHGASHCAHLAEAAGIPTRRWTS